MEHVVTAEVGRNSQNKANPATATESHEKKQSV